MGDRIFITQGLAIALITCGLGFYALLRGRKMLQAPDSGALDLPQLIAITWVRIFWGEAAAKRKKCELVDPNRIRRRGYYMIIAGCLLILGGSFQLLGWIGKTLAP